jgi:hypothetical protein
VRESAASKRARRAGHLNIPVHVEKDSHESTIGRYWIAFRIPITIETALENYGWRLSGPAAPRCVHNNTSSATSQSYLWVAGRRLRLVLGPPSTRPAWCPGRYTVKVVFVEKYSVPPRRGHRPVLRTRTRTLGTTSFTVSARGY